MLHNPESFENIPNHSGIIVESYLNHLGSMFFLPYFFLSSITPNHSKIGLPMGESNLKRNLSLSDSEGLRYPLKIRFGVFGGLQRTLSDHEGVARSPEGEDIAAR